MQTGIRLYQGVESRPLPNYAMIAGRDFRDADADGDGLNDGLWCQSAYQSVSTIGSWKFPNGDLVPDYDVGPIHMTHSPGQVGLLRGGPISSVAGMYICTIPDEYGVNQTLVVWTAVNSAYDGANGYREYHSIP